MNAKQKIHQAKLSQWAVRFQEQTDSGLTIKNWCNQNSISIHTYNYWKHALKEEYISSVLPDIVPVTSLVSSLPASGDVPNASGSITQSALPCSLDSRESRESCDTSQIHVTIGDAKISFASSASDEMICRIIRAVRHA